MKFVSAYKNLVLVMEPANFEGNKGRRITFSNGEYITNKQDEIDFIKANQGFGLYIFADKEQQNNIKESPEQPQNSAKEPTKKK